MPKILVVDDEKMIRWSLDAAFTSEGFEVKTADNGNSAMEELKKDKFDFMFLDIKMPEKNGIEVLKESRILSPGTKVFIITAYATNEIINEAFDYGTTDLISKPFNIPELVNRIKKLQDVQENI